MTEDDTDALTAFQLARRRGYRYSEQRWLESLRGEPGPRGEKGDRGERGPRGFAGERGVDGRDGRDGRDGIDGKNGADGVDGTLPDPVPWKATFDRGPNRLTRSIRIVSADGVAWKADVQRDPTGLIAEVQFSPVT